MRTRLNVAASLEGRGNLRRVVDPRPRPRRAFSKHAKHTAEDRALLRLIEKLRKDLEQRPAHCVGDREAQG